MGSRWCSKSAKGRFYFLCILALLVLSGTYVYLLNAQETSNNTKRCISELASVRYQLDEVTEYKSHVEKMLSDCQKSHHVEKDKFKDVAEVCDTMKQQSLLCQSQFDDLQSECRKVRERYNRVKNETSRNKEILIEEVKNKERLQQLVSELYTEIDNVHRSNAVLQKKLSIKYKEEDQAKQEDALDRGLRQPTKEKNFSSMIQISEGVYVVGNNTEEPSPELVDKVHLAKSDNNKDHFKAAVEVPDHRMRSHVPPGFAPVLQVPDSNNDAILQKPLDTHIIASDKANAPKPILEQERRLEERDSMPVHRDGALLEDHEVIDPEERHAGPEEGHHAAQEDDDEGEEYVA